MIEIIASIMLHAESFHDAARAFVAHGRQRHDLGEPELSFESLKTAPVAQEALDLIPEFYRVEHDAKQQQLSEHAHLELRKLRRRPHPRALQGLGRCAAVQAPTEEPTRRRDRYTLGQWGEIGVFLDERDFLLATRASSRPPLRLELTRA